MAFTSIGNCYFTYTANDVLTGRYCVSKISVLAGLTGGSTVIKAGGTSGTTILSNSIAASTTNDYVFPKPLYIDNLAVTTVGTNCVVTVYTV